MCNPTAIAVTNFAVQTMAAKAEYDDAKQRAKLQAQRNEQARKSAQKNYLSDRDLNLSAIPCPGWMSIAGEFL